jgi:hypothetical protein
LKYKGFEVCDTAEPYFELLYLPFEKSAEKPRFKECCKEGKIEKGGMVLYYSNQCPHTEKYGPLIAEIAKTRGISLELIRYQTKEQAQRGPTPFTTYGFFYEGKFVTNEIFSDNKFIKFLDEKGY